ncbi:Myb-related transcription factor, partner of profilin [Labeo rohita]|uniref:Myb-related transcription factor, partner of profilin n=1 Tax=Labeo rohita TaxID=84645 RepID=A0ABQ8LB67_LABRO|nr:Myb-related transcription factor, partner of profilin [Labeo rohita]
MAKRNPVKKKNFSELELDVLITQVQSNQLVLFGSLKSGIKGSQKNAVWNEITAAVNSVDDVNRTSVEVKKKWADLKLSTKKRLAALKRSTTQTGGGQPDPRFVLTPTEERVSALIGPESIVGISVGGDTDEHVSIHEEAWSLPHKASQPRAVTPHIRSPPKDHDNRGL